MTNAPGDSKHNNHLQMVEEPFQSRGLRAPRYTGLKTQITSFHGRFQCVSNAAGFLRVFLVPFTGVMGFYSDASHNETAAGAATDRSLPFHTLNMVSRRIVSAGLRAENTTTNNSKGGTLTAYESYLGYGTDTYDALEDSNCLPLKKQVSKTCTYHPADISEVMLWDSNGNNVLNSHHIGFVARGAPNQTFVIFYVLTVEYISGTYTDANPYSSGPHGSPLSAVIPETQNKKRTKIEISETQKARIAFTRKQNQTGKMRKLPYREKKVPATG